MKSSVIAVDTLAENEEFCRVHPDNGVQSNFRSEDGRRNTYVKTSDFREITEFSPLSVYPDTQNSDKLVIIIYNGTAPAGLFLEKTNIVAYIPVGLGGYPESSSTFAADYYVSSIRVTRNMNTLHGVPFTCYYNRTYGKAFHGAPWKDWSTIRKGFFGTAGCINLPCFDEASLYNVYWDNVRMGFDHFFFRWLKTIFPFNVYEQEMMEVPWNENDYYSGNNTLRTLVVKNIEDLRKYPTHPLKQAAYPTWKQIVSLYEGLKDKGEWIVPQKINGATQFLTVPSK